MTRSGIEPRSPESWANSLLIRPVDRLLYICTYLRVYACVLSSLLSSSNMSIFEEISNLKQTKKMNDLFTSSQKPINNIHLFIGEIFFAKSEY